MSRDCAAPEVLAARIADAARALPAAPARHLVAIAGPPGAGKSTVAQLAQRQLEQTGIPCGLLPMDGFHYDNAVLEDRGLLARKGAPETFDIAGFRALLDRLLRENEVAIPEFDRALDKSIAARAIIRGDQRLVLVEGNYLLLNEPGWSDLRSFWAATVFLNIGLQKIEARLTDRWLQHGLTPDAAKARALANDIPNARRIIRNSVPGDLVLS